MAIATTYEIGLSIPQESQERIRASVWRALPEGVDVQYPDSNYVRLFTVRSENPDIETIIRRSLDVVCFEKSPFPLVARRVHVRGTKVLVSVVSSGEPLPGCQNGAGHLRSLYAIFRNAVQSFGIDVQCMTPPYRFEPRIELGSVNVPCSFDAGATVKDLPEPSFEWQSDPFKLFTKRLVEPATS